MKKFVICIATIGVLSGCVSRGYITQKENEVIKAYYDADTVKGLLRAGQLMANEYLVLSDRVATTQDGVAVFNILLASGAAFGVVNGISAESLARIGIVGLGVGQTARYFDPEDAYKSLVTAAERQTCIVNAGYSYNLGDESKMMLILRNAFTKVRILLRKDLERDLVYYKDLFKEQNDALTRSGFQPLSSEEKLESAINTCLGAS